MLIIPMSGIEFTRETPPSVTKAFELAFAQGCYKISYRYMKTIDETGQSDIAITIDPINDINKEVEAMMNALDLGDTRVLKQAKEITHGTCLLLINKEEFEMVRDMGLFVEVDEYFKNKFLKNHPKP
jgi:hypothetical protein